MDDDDLWGTDVQQLRNSEWSKISSDFENAGYREGITAGKESALQLGFDEGFAQTGAPLGREIGLLRGIASALLSVLDSPDSLLPDLHNTRREELVLEARDIAAHLSEIRFSDIAPPDLEAEQHAREHLEATAATTKNREDLDLDVDMNEELKERRDLESLEDMMKGLGASANSSSEKDRRPTPDDVARLADRLKTLSATLGIPFPELRS
ncbi:hypothetical protein K474DRAFT_672258 [Panus rudis PR-1116 ss-1]|nr:hypothetical protein K474DRAFT_672258 [Panus rudis PR-1116 ss-1]